VQFEHFTDFPSAYHDPERYHRYLAEIAEHWRSLGWHEVPKNDEPAIKAAWVAHLEPGGELVIPKPSRTWRGRALARYREEPELEAEFTLKLLSAFRRCTRPGERLWALDSQHAWFYFDPNGGITAATRDQWAMPVLPDGDSHNFFAPDFRFGVVAGWRETGPVTLFGAELLDAVAADPPERFIQVCGPGTQSRV
jgi:hypothetical protein